MRQLLAVRWVIANWGVVTHCDWALLLFHGPGKAWTPGVTPGGCTTGSCDTKGGWFWALLATTVVVPISREHCAESAVLKYC